ncbi:MAG: bifunctional phosphoribosylaminoimidazolecarboxamide formyltransferase/IMP cyclohydrolase [Planctomycetales bacterium 4484_113]|nr:MAG: bifunctional phosphoribosylaminoimidazolecarboxamide formyltransferase/IMP cyclohydrolase [Planctomycetales bacterium 4484_113]
MGEIKVALISVSDKTWVSILARFLEEEGVTVYASKGTQKALREKKIKAQPIEKLTRNRELLGGRLKTLDYRIFAGILGNTSRKRDREQLQEVKATPIDLVVANFYPFDEKVRRGKTKLETAQKLVDIGGVALVRAAAKNFRRVVVLVDPEDYKKFINEYRENEGRISSETRLRLAAKAFTYCQKYDEAIADYFRDLASSAEVASARAPEAKKRPSPALTDRLQIKLKVRSELRYGENPHQRARLYASSDDPPVPLQVLQGRQMSYNNFQDASAAFRICRMPYAHEKAACVLKHMNPCGAAIGDDTVDVIKRALAGDPLSAFGGIVGVNFVIDEAEAKELTRTFLEVVVAPKFTLAALREFSRKHKVRLVEVGAEAYQEQRDSILKYNEGKAAAPLSFVRTSFGYLVQEEDLRLLQPGDTEVVSDSPLRFHFKEDLTLGVTLVRFLKSNSIAIVKDLTLVGTGTGQPSRVGAVKLALSRAGKRAAGAVLVSDAFFPFADSVELAAGANIGAVAAPSGSIRDHEVIERANQLGICLVFLPTRHFYH